MGTLEKKHVELYPCDKKQEELKTLHTEAEGLQQEKAKGELIQWLNDLIRRWMISLWASIFLIPLD